MPEGILFHKSVVCFLSEQLNRKTSNTQRRPMISCLQSRDKVNRNKVETNLVTILYRQIFVDYAFFVLLSALETAILFRLSQFIFSVIFLSG